MQAKRLTKSMQLGGHLKRNSGAVMVVVSTTFLFLWDVRPPIVKQDEKCLAICRTVKHTINDQLV